MIVKIRKLKKILLGILKAQYYKLNVRKAINFRCILFWAKIIDKGIIQGYR